MRVWKFSAEPTARPPETMIRAAVSSGRSVSAIASLRKRDSAGSLAAATSRIGAALPSVTAANEAVRMVSTFVASDERTTIFTPESREDAVDMAVACNSTPENTMFVGMCSGAWNACHAAMHVPARAVSLVNMTDWAIKRQQFVKRSTMQVTNGSQTEKAADLLHRNAARIKGVLRQWLPYQGWLMLGKQGILQVPEVMLRPLAESGVDITVLLSPPDAEWFLGNQGARSLQRLRRDGWKFRFSTYGTGDHSLYSRDMRESVRADLIFTVLDRFDLAPDTGRPDEMLAAG